MSLLVGRLAGKKLVKSGELLLGLGQRLPKVIWLRPLRTVEERFESEVAQLFVFDLKVGRDLDELLFQPLDLHLAVLLLLLELVLEQLDLFKLGVELQLKVANDETATAHLVLEFLILYLKLDDFGSVEFAFFNLLLEISLGLIELPLRVRAVLLQLILISLCLLELFGERFQLFILALDSELEVFLGSFQFGLVLGSGHCNQSAISHGSGGKIGTYVGGLEARFWLSLGLRLLRTGGW